MSDEISTHLAEAVETRRRELGLSPSDFAKATGLTAQALLNLRKGYVRDYQDRLTKEVCRVFDWTPDSIDRLLRGERPVPLEPQPATASVEDAAPILDAIAGATEKVTDAMEAVNSRLQGIEEVLRRIEQSRPAARRTS